MSDFSTLGISKLLIDRLQKHNITKPTPIQEQTIPSVLEGKDLIGQAQTGTGKTLAFILPIIQNVDFERDEIQALIVAPTRELAIQITAEIEKLLAEQKDSEVLAVYGGQDVEKQLKKLKRNVAIVVATPGRLLDHMRRGTIDITQISTLVLDEADQMLHIGFQNEIEKIIGETADTRQTLLFSATMSPEVRQLAEKHTKNARYIQVEKKQGPADLVEQWAVMTTDRGKQPTIIELVNKDNPFLAVIFCRTKRRVSHLLGVLRSNGFDCDELHSDLSQAKREQVMKRFRTAKIQLLVATDVAARGLDVEGITHVYNYDIPEDVESYVHRIGRTGRAGMDGTAVTLYTDDDLSMLKEIENELKISIPNREVDVDLNMKIERPTETPKKRDHSNYKPKKTFKGRGKKQNNNQRSKRR
ncbi:MAG: DEAD/DEAH box helicase [Bacillus sp. (in: firmicutes)]